MIAPMSGPATYTQKELQSPLTSAGPNERAGFIEVPLTGAAHSPARAMYPPTPSAPTRANVLCLGSRAEDHADQSPGERDLEHERLPRVIAGSGQRGAEMPDVSEHGEEKHRRQGCAEKLRKHVPRHARPGKVAS